MAIAEAPLDAQTALQEVYESNQIRGKKFATLTRLVESRKRHGKTFRHGRDRISVLAKKQENLSSKAIMDIFQREMDEKNLVAKKASLANERLVFITEALRCLFNEDNFHNLLRAENLSALPKPIAAFD